MPFRCTPAAAAAAAVLTVQLVAALNVDLDAAIPPRVDECEELGQENTEWLDAVWTARHAAPLPRRAIARVPLLCLFSPCAHGPAARLSHRHRHARAAPSQYLEDETAGNLFADLVVSTGTCDAHCKSNSL